MKPRRFLFKSTDHAPGKGWTTASHKGKSITRSQGFDSHSYGGSRRSN